MKRVMIFAVVLMLCIIGGGAGSVVGPMEAQYQLHEKKTMTVEDAIAVMAQMEEYDEELDALAKLVWGEARGVKSKAERAGVIWCVLNRVDVKKRGSNIIQCASARKQFAYGKWMPVEQELRDLAEDVLFRWLLEKRGVTDVGRVLPKEYLYFASHGDGHNWFRIPAEWKPGEKKVYWNWSLPDPYEEE